MMLWITIVMDVIFIFLAIGYLITDIKSKESTWIKETRYYEAFPSIDIPMDRSDNRVAILSELKSRSNLRCVKCGCVYIPTPNCESSPTPKYCPECGRRMINWKEIKI